MCSIILLVALTQALFGLAEDGRRWAWNPYSQSVSTHDNFTISKLSIIGSQSSSDDTPAQILTSPSQTIGTKEANLSSIPQALLVLSDRDDGDLWAWNPYSPGANYSVPKTIISSGSSSDEAPQILTPSTCTQKSDLKNLEGRSSSTPLPPLGSPQSLISNPSPQRGLYGSFNSMPPALLTPVHSCAKSPISPQILPLASPSRARLIGKPLYVGKPVVPSWAALPMDEYVRLIPQSMHA